jgi:hypothetical protein
MSSRLRRYSETRKQPAWLQTDPSPNVRLQNGAQVAASADGPVELSMCSYRPHLTNLPGAFGLPQMRVTQCRVRLFFGAIRDSF